MHSNQKYQQPVFKKWISKKYAGIKLFAFRNNSIRKILIFSSFIVSCCNYGYAQASLETNKVMSFFSNQQYDEAISYLTSLETNNTVNLQVLGYLAYANHMNENNPAADKFYRRILDLDSNNIAALQFISNDDNTGTGQALLLTRRLVGLQPKKPSYHKNLADLLRKTAQRDSAMKHYEQAYQLAPHDYRYVAAYAEILLDQKQTPKADSLLNTGLLEDSMNISYLVLRIRSAYEAKDYASVLLPGERLIRTGEKTLNPFLKLSLSYYNLKMYSDCIRVCDYLLLQGFQVESVYYYQARSWAKLNEFVKSNELLQFCLAIAISNTAEMYYYNLGENNEAMKQYKKAVTYYDSAFYLFRNANMLYNAGRVTESSLRNDKLATKYYSRYLDRAKPQTADEKKVYEYVRNRLSNKKANAGK